MLLNATLHMLWFPLTDSVLDDDEEEVITVEDSSADDDSVASSDIGLADDDSKVLV